MSDLAFDDRAMGGGAGGGGGEPRRPNANLGSAEAEEIFMALDTRVVRRFAAYLKPHPWYVAGAVGSAIVSSMAQLVQPLMPEDARRKEPAAKTGGVTGGSRASSHPR